MRVLQIVKTSDGARWAFDQTKALIERGIDVITVLPSKSGRVAEKYIENNFPIIEADLSLPVSRPWKLFGRKKLFRKIVEETAPDLIHCHFVTNIIMARLSLGKSKVKRVFQVPGPLHLESKLFRALDIKTAKSNDYWIGTCNKTVQIYKDCGIDEGRVFLGYYGGYGGESCDEYLSENSALHDEFGIGSDRKTVGMVSYIYKPKRYARQKRGIKGHEDFIDAMKIVMEKHPEAIGVVVGGPWGNSQKYFEKIKKYAFEQCGDNIVFTGFRTDIKDIYCEIDIVVHPSHSENLGGAAESLAAGRPTISTNIGGFPDIVKDGITGYTVPMKNPTELADAIIRMLENEEKADEMAQEGRKLVREMLDIEGCADKIFEVFHEIV
ncbi:MAG: glycosyltransferase family 4 protein [Clostridia bacterium]|nr:glycosyltransferase family 4 protein [Clostridia bacterium]